jgi:activator of HSP90 ATPase
VNIRKGKKIVEYDYNITAEWKGEGIEGSMDIVMDSVSGKEPTITFKEQLEGSVKDAFTSKIKAALTQFIEELNSK